MDDKTKKLVDVIKHEIDGLYDDNVLFRDRGVETRLEAACLKFILSRGYKLSEDSIPQHPEIKNIHDIIKFFYGMLDKYHPEMLKYRNNEQDMAIAREFVNSRKLSDGLNEKDALAQCVEIIKTIFENEERFNFTMPLNFGMFGQKNCAWITEVAVRLLNERIQREKEELDERLADEFMNRFYSGPKGWSTEEIVLALSKLEGE
jgi:hypothetical protein